MFNKLYRSISFIINIRRRYFDSRTFIYDERISDHRDHKLWGISVPFDELPDDFILNDFRYQNQSIESNLFMSCTAQSTTNAANQRIYTKLGGKFSKKAKELFYSGKQLWNKMLEKGLASLTQWAYLIDAIKVAKEENIISEYFQTTTLSEILNAIYVGKPVIAWSTKIDWSKCEDWFVKYIWKWDWHAFVLMWFDKDVIIWDYKWAICCENSYWEDYQINWYFWIPFDLVEKILFNTRKAIET